MSKLRSGASLDPVVGRQLSTAATSTITSQLQRRGIRSTFLSGLSAVGHTTRMVGVARTVRYLPMREDVRADYSGDNSAQRVAVEAIEPGEVLVISARGVPDAGTIGDLYALRAMARGAAGVVTDGATRDTPAIAALELPVFARAKHGATLMRTHLAVDTQVPIDCAGVLILPGDVLVGDAEGVVVIPRALVHDVAAAAEEEQEEETFAAMKLAAGEACDGLFPLTDARRDEFTAWRLKRSATSAGGAAT